MSSGIFSTPENVSLERQAEFDQESVNFENIWTEGNRELSRNWINKNQFKRVCLQFPDTYLIHSTKICDDLKHLCSDVKFFILADTSYGSCCVDEIAAAHVDSDSIVHFGDVCKSKVSGLPVLYVLPQLPFDCDSFKHHLTIQTPSLGNATIFLEIGYQYLLGKLQETLSDMPQIRIENFPIDDKSRDCSTDVRDVCIFIGHDGQSFFNASMSLKASKWILYNPSSNKFDEVNPLTTKFILKRYYYIEKCKYAQRLGLIVATLTAEGCLDVVKRIQNMAKSRRIKTHLISVGRVNPAKLANFMEIDCFVMIGCPFNNLYTSREFFKPIVSVFEAEMALNPAWKDKFPETYATDFKDILPNGKLYNEFEPSSIPDCDINLVTGRLHGIASNGMNVFNSSTGGEMMEIRNQQVMQINGGMSFEDRSWRGLEPALENREPAKLEKGLSGIPIRYTHD